MSWRSFTFATPPVLAQDSQGPQTAVPPHAKFGGSNGVHKAGVTNVTYEANAAQTLSGPSTVEIGGPPTCSGAGPGTLTCTNSHGLYVQAASALSSGATVTSAFAAQFDAPLHATNSNWSLFANGPSCLGAGCTTALSGLSASASSAAVIINGAAGTTTNDLAGTVSTSTSPITFSPAFVSAPICVLTPQADPGLGVRWSVSTTNTALTLATTSGTSAVFNYICIGNPN